jgi:hypothetical protein
MAAKLDCRKPTQAPRVLLAFGVALPLAGCVVAQVRSMPIGRSVASKPPDCPVREERLTPREAQDRYQQIGVICYFGWGAGTSTTPGPTHSADFMATPPVPRTPAPSPAQTAHDSVTLVNDVRTEVCQLGGEIVVRQGFCTVRRHYESVELGVYAATPSVLSRGSATSDGSPSP